MLDPNELLNVDRLPDGDAVEAGSLHLWLINLEQRESTLRALGATLSDGERERAARFRFERDRRRFTVAHGALRSILARYLGRPPAVLEFCLGAYGKPALLDSGAPALQFNLSHAHERALVAVAHGRQVGVDIEWMRPFEEVAGLADFSFSPYEREQLRSCPTARRAEAFFNCWTRKEAFIKAIGMGLSCPLDSFDVSCLPGEPAALLRVPEQWRNWSLAAVDAPDGYRAAVAAEGTIAGIVYRQWPAETG